MKSIDIAQSASKKQIPPLTLSSKKSLYHKDSERKIGKRLEELGISTQQFRLLFDNLPQGVALFKMVYNNNSNPSGLILLENNKAYDDIHVFKRQHFGKQATQFITKLKNKPVNWIDIYHKVATTGRPQYFETYGVSQKRWYQVCAYSPKTDFIISVFMDVTKQNKQNARDLGDPKRWAQELFISETKYRRLYETTQDGIMARDLQGRMIDCNKAYAKMLGYSKKELRGLSFSPWCPRNG